MECTILSEHPTRFQLPEPCPCEDCEQMVTILTDTMVGYLCDECAKRLFHACRVLAKYGEGK